MKDGLAGRPGRRRPGRRVVERRVGRGQILYDAPELVIPFMVPDGAHSYPDAAAHRGRAHHVHRRRRRGGAGTAGGAGRARGRQLLDRLDDLRPRRGAPRSRPARRTGNRWAPSRSATPPRSRRHRATRRRSAICWCADEPCTTPRSALLTDWEAPDPGSGLAAARGAGVPAAPGRTAACGPACPGTSPPRRWCSTTPARTRLLTLHPRFGRWLQLGGHCEDTDADIAAAALREATEESGIDGPADRRRTGRGARAPGDLLAGCADPSPRPAVRRARPGRGASR